MRNEARASLIAYGFLRGKRLSQIEQIRKNDVSSYDGLWHMAKRRAGKIAEKFSDEPADIIRERYEQWIKNF